MRMAHLNGVGSAPSRRSGSSGEIQNGRSARGSPLHTPRLLPAPVDSDSLRSGGGTSLAAEPQLWEKLLRPENGLNGLSSASWKPDENLPEPDAPAPGGAHVFNGEGDPWYSDILAQDLAALTLKRRTEATGLFGVGLQVSDDPPHVVQRVSRLLDKDQRNVSESVPVGDTLYSVNDFQVEMSSIDTVEQLIFGEMGTTVRLTFCNSLRQKYDIVVIRHVPISVWEQERVWYEIRPELQGCDLRCDPSIVNLLETVRATITKGSAVPADLLKDFHHVQTTLGFRIGLQTLEQGSISCVVQQVIPGSAADQGNGLQPGDKIVAVNGIHISDCDERVLLEAFRGDDTIGSKCRLTIERPDQPLLGPLDVEVMRTNASFAKEVEQLFLLGHEHASLLQSQSSFDTLHASLQAMMHQAVALERHRILHEQVMAARLHDLQLRVLESVTEAEKRIYPAAEVPAASSVGNHLRIRDLEERWEYVSGLLLLLKGPPPVAPSKMARAITSANMSANDIVRILEAASSHGKGANDIIALIRGNSQGHSCTQRQMGSRSLTDDPLTQHREQAPESRVSPKPARTKPPAPPNLPRIHPSGGTFSETVPTSITSSTPGTTIYYTTDGSSPNEGTSPCGASPLWIQVEKSLCVRAICVANDGLASEIVEATFDVQRPPAGIGLLLEKSDRDGSVRVVKILAAGAAHEDGTIQLRDQLTHVDDTSVASLALEQILDLIKGGEGTKVHLTLWRGERAFRVELRRKRVKQVGLVSTATKRSLNSNNTASAGRKTLSSITTGT